MGHNNNKIMKRVGLLIILACLCAIVIAQEKVNDSKYPAYCHIWIRNYHSNTPDIRYEFGFPEEDRIVKKIYDEEGAEIEFKTVTKLVNYLAKRGWRMFSWMYHQNPDVFDCVMEKYVDSDEETFEGIRIKK